jgi:D-sedoheptulose 7-phosphate isomerase
VTSISVEQHLVAVEKVLEGLEFREKAMGFSSYLADAIHGTRASDGTVYVVGNGGSAANASHLALHIVNAGTKSVAVADNSALFSASGNDHGQPATFKSSIPYAHRSDVLVVLSCSGTSQNIKSVVADFRGTVIAVYGTPPSPRPQAVRNVDMLLRIPSDDYGVIEDVQSILLHMAAKQLTAMK